MTIGEDERVSLQAVAEMHNITVEQFKFSMSKSIWMKLQLTKFFSRSGRVKNARKGGNWIVHKESGSRLSRRRD